AFVQNGSNELRKRRPRSRRGEQSMQASFEDDPFLRARSRDNARHGTRHRSLRALLAAAASICVLVALVLVVLLPASATGASAIASGPNAFGSSSSQHVPPACWRPYGPQSPFNMQLPSDPQLAPDSQAIVDRMVALGDHFEGGPSRFALVSAGRGAV